MDPDSMRLDRFGGSDDTKAPLVTGVAGALQIILPSQDAAAMPRLSKSRNQ